MSLPFVISVALFYFLTPLFLFASSLFPLSLLSFYSVSLSFPLSPVSLCYLLPLTSLLSLSLFSLLRSSSLSRKDKRGGVRYQNSHRSDSRLSSPLFGVVSYLSLPVHFRPGPDSRPLPCDWLGRQVLHPELLPREGRLQETVPS